MKKIIITFSLFTIMLNSYAQPSCQSIFSGAANIFDNVAREYIKFRMEAAQVFIDVILPGKQGASSALDDLIESATKMQIDLYNAYGIISGQSNATVGAVNLIVPLKTWNGDLYTERTFQILNSPYDKVVIKITKTGGRRGVKFTACAKYSNGSPYDRKSGEIDNGNETDGQTRTLTFDRNMLDKNISLHLVAHGALPTDKCDYKLSVEGFFDDAEMNKIAKENNLKPKGDKANNEKSINPSVITPSVNAPPGTIDPTKTVKPIKEEAKKPN
jgi:hypothetical protein